MRSSSIINAIGAVIPSYIPVHPLPPELSALSPDRVRLLESRPMRMLAIFQVNHWALLVVLNTEGCICCSYEPNLWHGRSDDVRVG